MRPMLSLGLALFAALALAACGRKGPLELPPGAPPAPAAQSTAPRVPTAAATGPRTQKETDVFSERSVPRPINGPPQQKSGFFLDPLL